MRRHRARGPGNGTEDWRKVPRDAPGENLSTRSIVDYFKPLTKWLEEQNRGRLEKSLIATNGCPNIGSTELLWHLDSQHAGVVPALRRALEDTNSGTRGFAAYWYWKVTGDSDLSLKILSAGLEEPASGVSQSFPQWMEKMGPAARPAVPH